MQDIQKLIDVKHELDAGDATFATSLIMQHKAKGKLSEKQWHWVHKLIMRAEGTSSDKPEPTTTIKPLTGLMEMFAKAGKKLKFPAIVLKDANEDDIRISLAASNSKNPGYLYVKRFGGYLGKVSPAGDVFVNDPLAVQVLTALSEDPVGYAAAHGHATGKCCFCNSTLTDEKSTNVGYGPVCAKHYDLPWGKETFSTPAEVDAVNMTAMSELAQWGSSEVDEEVVLFEQEQMEEKARRPMPELIPGRACKDLLEYMEQS